MKYNRILLIFGLALFIIALSSILSCKQADEEILDIDKDLFDKINRNDSLYQYIVFLPELKLSSRITLRDNFENFDMKKFKLHLFHDEESFKRKIRLELL
jgi:hypothetical protein